MVKHITENTPYTEEQTHDIRDGKLYIPLRTTLHDVTDQVTGEIYHIATSGVVGVWSGTRWDLFNIEP